MAASYDQRPWRRKAGQRLGRGRGPLKAPALTKNLGPEGRPAGEDVHALGAVAGPERLCLPVRRGDRDVVAEEVAPARLRIIGGGTGVVQIAVEARWEQRRVTPACAVVGRGRQRHAVEHVRRRVAAAVVEDEVDAAVGGCGHPGEELLLAARLYSRRRRPLTDVTRAEVVSRVDVRGAGLLVGVGQDDAAALRVDGRMHVLEDPVVGVRQHAGDRADDLGGNLIAAPGRTTVARLVDYRDIVLQALLVRAVDPADVDGAVGPDRRDRVLIELIALVADPDGAGPVQTVIVRVGDVDRGAAGAAELSPGHEEPPEVMALTGTGVHGHRLVVGHLAVRTLLASVRRPGR